MLTYLLLILGFGTIIVLSAWRWLLHADLRAIAITAGSVLVLSVVFDNLIVGLRIVAYNSGHILGLLTPIAPIEDYGYTVFGAILVPAVWRLTARLGKDRSHD